jgi:hypothetical protein
VLFDSTPGCFPNTLDKLKGWLAGSPLTTEGCKWIAANMPHQGKGMNACRVWMCYMAALYVKHLLDHELLANSGKVQEKMISSVSVVAKKGATEVRGEGRKHKMEHTIKTNECKLDDVVVLCIHKPLVSLLIV